MYCSQCGKTIKDDSKFCRYCGSTIELENLGTKQGDINTINTNENSNLSPATPSHKIDQTDNKENFVSKFWKEGWWQKILLIVLYPITLTYIIYQKKSWSLPKRVILILLFWLLTIVIGLSDETSDTQPQVNTAQNAVNKTATETTPIKEEQPKEELEDEVTENRTDELQEQRETYLLEMAEIAGSHSEALSIFSDILANEPEKILYDDNTRTRLAAQMTLIRLSFKDAEKIVPPEEFKEIHNTILLGYKKHSEAMDYVTKGIDNYDVDALNKSRELLDEGTVYIVKATSMLNDMNE